ncbi:MAG: hypothetical protein QG616_391 [Pseudomonadota bacterium]|nr:hypothetical protein [Pseudomonadota bacterium]MDQ5880561.1 hypothetical protein [Pseudomonadota bacterium]MDQ5903446.1 hypothetical protein [Pseudomonadota bacterium]MDQ5907582.1 hypothetical protein [Pseudomonadota bacterium]MDQ5914865.1 hypothetical protein [Pseudomonadota bacterium]
MSRFPEVQNVQIEGWSVTLLLMADPSLDYFPGHFPGFPILPGVVQVDWAIRFARKHLGIPCTAFAALRALKFSAPVLPGTALTLQIAWVPEKQKLDFSYRDTQRIVSSGQIVFAAEAVA